MLLGRAPDKRSSGGERSHRGVVGRNGSTDQGVVRSQLIGRMMKQTQVASMTLALLLAAPATANAYTQLTDGNGNALSWPNGEYKFRVDTSSMVNGLNGSAMTMNTTDYGLWTTYAAGLWRTRSGADIDITYDGTTTLGCGHVNDGVNVIAATPPCDGAGCGVWARASWTYSGSNLMDVDICLFGASATWDVRTDMASGSKDVVGVLVHEIGHALGADHTTGAVMQSNTHGVGNTLSRFPYGDDIDYIRDTYGVRSHSEFFKEYSASTESWLTTNAGSGTLNMAPNGAIGRESDGSWEVMRAKVTTTGTSVHFTRADYPLAASPVWTNRGSATQTWRSPAVAARNTSDERWVAGWPLEQVTIGCAGARFFSSADGFNGATAANISDICTIHGLGMAYDPVSQRFVMAYVGHYPDGSSQEFDTGRVFIRTSTNGWSWPSSGEVDTGLFASTDPGLACRADGSCVLSYTNGSSVKQYGTQRAFTVSSAGGITLGSSLGSSNWVGAAPQIATSTTGSPDSTILQLPWATSWGNIAKGAYFPYSVQDDTFPVFTAGWTAMGDTVQLRPAMASNPGRMRVYSFFAK
jgi:Matrixin